ncbi:MAG: Chaperone SurA [Alphaproteobacteria bacterium MarineAlpha2_Bin1]|nr:MAG: Chaperone SurA [Alphaproteobacteria bacterium MarineAlpha2_Bin1]
MNNTLKKIILIIFLIFTFIKIGFSDILKIAVVVNDEIISEYDINERIKLITFSSEIKNNNLKNKVLNLLIDEKIKIQESRRIGFNITEKDIERGINIIEKQNNMKKGDLKIKLNEKKISLHTLIDQLTGEILWQKVLSKKILPQVAVTENELEEALKIESNNLKIKNSIFNISQIIFDKKTKINSKEIYENLKNIKKCEDFEKKGKIIGAKTSTNLGYINVNDTPQNIKSALNKLDVGDKSNFIKTSTGIQIFMVCDIKLADISKQKNKVRQQIARKKIFNLSKKYLDDLKRNSVIDIRQ